MGTRVAGAVAAWSGRASRPPQDRSVLGRDGACSFSRFGQHTLLGCGSAAVAALLALDRPVAVVAVLREYEEHENAEAAQ